MLTATNTTDFNQYEVDGVAARYVKIMGYGRYNTAGDTRTSVWSAVGEIELYGSDVVSTNEFDLVNQAILFPDPAHNHLHIENIAAFDEVAIYTLDGRKLMEEQNLGSTLTLNLDVSSLVNGAYLVVLKGEGILESKRVLIAR